MNIDFMFIRNDIDVVSAKKYSSSYYIYLLV